jgi:DNA-binding HxlR family transcriptional regulator
MVVKRVRGPIDACSLPAALEAVGERWAFLILRAAFNGVRHFETFQSELGIARNILSDRLGKLVEHGILAREALAEDRRKIDYRLTAKGSALLPTMVALRQWGEQWELGRPASPVLVDSRDGEPVCTVVVTSHDGRVLGEGEVIWAAVE